MGSNREKDQAAAWLSEGLARQVTGELSRLMRAVGARAGLVAVSDRASEPPITVSSRRFPDRALFEGRRDGRSLIGTLLRRRSPALFQTSEIIVPRAHSTQWRALGSVLAVPLSPGLHCPGFVALGGVNGGRRLRPAEQMALRELAGPIAELLESHRRSWESAQLWQQYSAHLLDDLGQGLIGLDRAERVVVWSQAAERILGLPADQTLGRHLREVMEDAARRQHCPPSPAVSEWAREVIASRQASHGYQFSYGPAQAPRVLELNGTPVRTEAGYLAGLALLVRDITDQKEVEDQMAQVTQLAAVGYMAASVAHEIRNPLSAIKAAAQYLQRECEDNPLIAQFAGIIDEESNRLTKVVTDFLIYARPQPPRLVPVHLPELAERCLTLLEHELARVGVTVTVDPAPELPMISADPEQLQQVLLNLCSNSVQAMETGGELHIGIHLCRVQTPDRPELTEAAELVITDTGSGIAPEHMSQIFTPFYTTKTKGSGLGLAIVQRIVENHGGSIEIQSDPGAGTRCRVCLPVAAPTPQEEQSGRASVKLSKAQGGQLTLLQAMES